jgi:putative NADH-flavin reductase
MSTAVIGATGRVGSEIVRGVLARGDAVAALVAMTSPVLPASAVQAVSVMNARKAR